MTLISPTITPVGSGALRITWSGTADREVRVFLNGHLMVGPTLYATADKSIDVIPFDPCTIEVHENPVGEDVISTRVKLERKPLIWWSTVSGASFYRTYIADFLRALELHEPDAPHLETTLVEDVRLDDDWWSELRVEAVTSNGVETTSTASYVFVPGVLGEASVAAADSSPNVFDFTLTPL